MRGKTTPQVSMMCLVSPDSVVPQDHPIRAIKVLADTALRRLSTTFDAMYGESGRPSIPPERLLKATLLMAFYTVRSERMFCEQLAYNLLFRWFLDMDMTEPCFERTAFSHNRQRLIEHDVAREFFNAIVAQAKEERLMSVDHFTVDGTLIDAWASMKSFKKKESEDRNPPDDPGNPTVNFRGEKRCNDTHESTTDPEARLARKSAGTGARLCYSAHSLMENRNGLLVDFRIAEANGFAERSAALQMLDEALPGRKTITVAADKAYDTSDFVLACRELNAVPHVAKNESERRRSNIDARTTRHVGYRLSQRLRKRVEEIFGWMKTVGNFRKSRYKGSARTQLAAYFVGAAYNLIRMAKLLNERTI
jgi:transposase